MTGDAVTNYADFAQGTRDALDHLSGVESDLGHRLHEAAEAVTAAKHGLAVGARRGVLGVGCA